MQIWSTLNDINKFDVEIGKIELILSKNWEYNFLWLWAKPILNQLS